MLSPTMRTPSPATGSEAVGGGGGGRMNVAGRYQSRRYIGAAFDSVKDQKLQVRAEPRRGSILTGPQMNNGRRRSIAIPEIHFEVMSQTSEVDSTAARPDGVSMFGATRDRHHFLERVGAQLDGEAHSTLLGVHGDILTRTVPPQITLEMYREVVPVLAQCVKAYTNSLGRNHKLTAECIERHRECSARLEQLEAMHEVAAEPGAAGAAGSRRNSQSPDKNGRSLSQSQNQRSKSSASAKQ